MRLNFDNWHQTFDGFVAHSIGKDTHQTSLLNFTLILNTRFELTL